MGEIRPKKCEPRELTKDQLADDPHGGDAAYMLWPHKLLVGAVQQSGWCGEVHPNNSAPWDSFKSIEQCNTSTKIGCLFNVLPQHFN